jgi:hypothetical protein
MFPVHLSNVHKLSFPTCCLIFIIYCSYMFVMLYMFPVHLSNVHKLSFPTCCLIIIIYCSYMFIMLYMFPVHLSNVHKLSFPTCCLIFIIYCSYMFRPWERFIFRELQVCWTYTAYIASSHTLLPFTYDYLRYAICV